MSAKNVKTCQSESPWLQQHSVPPAGVIFLLEKGVWSNLPLCEGTHGRWPGTPLALPGDGGHGSAGSRWPQPGSAFLQWLLLFREAKAGGLHKPGDFPASLPSTSKFSGKVKPPRVIYCHQPAFRVGWDKKCLFHSIA